jgi:prepilin-type N-terminal cleavage/methylation domain-containing protein
MSASHYHKAVRGGFTLIEVMVSAAVLAIVLAVMFSALSTSMSLWRNTDNKIVADREARAVHFLLSRDLANVVMPASTNLWPRIVNSRVGRDDVYYLKFLTAVPAAGQSATGAEAGDVCYVEYVVATLTNTPGKVSSREVRRLFWPSGLTYTNVIKADKFPTNDVKTTNFQSLGLNLLSTNSMAARGLGTLSQWVNATNFMLLGTDMLPFTGVPGPNNYPAAIEVNFAVADPTTLANTNLINRSTYVLRNAGLYSFRIPLPKPSSAP